MTENTLNVILEFNINWALSCSTLLARKIVEGLTESLEIIVEAKQRCRGEETDGPISVDRGRKET